MGIANTGGLPAIDAAVIAAVQCDAGIRYEQRQHPVAEVVAANHAVLTIGGTGKRLTKQTVHLFAGLTYCACGGRMYVPSNTPKYVCKACRTKIPIVDLDAVFHERLKNFFFSTEELAAHLREADAVLQEKETLLSVLTKERVKLSTEIDKLYELYQSGAIDKTGFGAKYHPLAERQRQLDDELPKIQAEVDVMKIAHLSQDEIVSEARDLYSRWPTIPTDERRHIIEAITERITIGTDEVSIDLYYVPPTVSRPSSSPSAPSLHP